VQADAHIPAIPFYLYNKSQTFRIRLHILCACGILYGNIVSGLQRRLINHYTMARVGLL
jgi:hypothetical protein